jgi:hypothetical protein
VASVSPSPGYSVKRYAKRAAVEPGLTVARLRQDGTALARFPQAPQAA